MRNNITNKKLIKIFKNEGSRELREMACHSKDTKLKRRIYRLLDYIDQELQALDWDDFLWEHFMVTHRDIKYHWDEESSDAVDTVYEMYLNHVITTDDIDYAYNEIVFRNAYYDKDSKKFMVAVG